MSRTYRQPHEDEDRQLQLVRFPLDRVVCHLDRHRTRLFVERYEAVEHELIIHGVSLNNHARNELTSLACKRGCPPAKAVSIITGAPCSRFARPRIVNDLQHRQDRR